jgi:uncharacterized protein (DUF305 family)
MTRRAVVIVSAVVALAAAVGVGVALSRSDGTPEGPPPRVVQPGAPGQSARTLSPDELGRLSAPPHAAADADFMRRMIPHHAQALEMTALVADRSASPDLPLLARRIEVSQRDEIAQMERWLMARGEALPAAHADHRGMPGMLSASELAALTAARGTAFDRMFLELMIRHHRGAITMVDELYAAGGGIEPASDQFAREVNADQTIEIRRMQELLADLS